MLVLDQMQKHYLFSQGKGVTKELAKVSAFMEAIELWFAENISIPDMCGSYCQLIKDFNCLQPSSVYSELFDNTHLDDASIAWLAGKELISDQDAFLPFDLLYLNDTLGNVTAFKLNRSTNGLASGNNTEEALIHAICEVIERHNYFHWLKSDIAISEVSHQGFQDKDIDSIVDSIMKPGHRLHIFDATIEIALPTFVCIIVDANNKIRPAIGKGAHLNKRVAVLRALTEAAQSRLTLISGSRDDILSDQYRMFPLSVIERKQDLVDFNAIACLGLTGSISQDLDLLIDLIAQHGFKKIFFHEHKKSVKKDFSIVHVVIPGTKFTAEAGY